mmetsp:Transcript_44174/g.120371  ORF Transcript_44174/g.120371 Transcript_44174/m.120371 type:complete len:112 (-) Transcript_44174:269-604(-)
MCTEQQLQLGQCAEEITEMSMALMKTSKRERSEGETQFIQESLEKLKSATDFKSMQTLDNYLDGDSEQKQKAEEAYATKMKLFKARKAAANIRSSERGAAMNSVNGGEATR